MPRFTAALFVVMLMSPCIPWMQAEDITSTDNLTFTTIDFPGAVATNVLGINSSGDIVGGYSGGSLPDHGFLYRGGIYTTIDYPTGWTTTTSGINDSGVIVGQSTNQRLSATLGFRYDGTTFTPIQVPGAGATEAYGINNAGLIVGGDSDSVEDHAFALIGSRFKDVTPPPGGFLLVYATGINNSGEIVGWTTAASTNGFTYKAGKFQTIRVPGSIWTELWGLNDGGAVVGSYQQCSPCTYHAFVLSNRKYYSIDYPGADETFGFGINKLGQVVGAYTLNNATHGFVTSPLSDAQLAD